ncbi:MAG: NAD-dependent epimerase/dehydratase family protein, partial [Halobacteriovoraceae bacterium]|nr:NAD-dependent epimerase/dehydratase family protein [Halobacteriovoraceae bacterium]
GFVGGHLIERLHERGVEHFGLARSQKKWNEFDLPGSPILGDLGKYSVEHWVSNLPADLTHFVHTAGVVHSFDELIFDKINFEATKVLFEALKKRFPKLHFIFFSSLAAVGPSQRLEEHTEESELNPPSLYGQSKKKAEDFLIAEKPLDWSLTIIRPPMVIGPRDPAVLDIFKMVKGKFILGTGINGKNKLYSFVCVHDLVSLVEKVLDYDHGRVEVFFSSHPKNYTFKDITDSVAKTMKKKTVYLPVPLPAISALAHTMNAFHKIASIEFRLTPDKLHELRPEAWTCSGKKSESILEMEYLWDLDKTVKATYEDYISRGWL